MNQYKLRSLMFHSGFLTDDGGWDNRPIHEQEDNFKRFAELIVRECCELTLDYKNEAHYNGWLDHCDAIKKHFGVE